MLDLLPVMGETRGLWGCWKERRLNPQGLHQMGDALRDTQSLSESQTQHIPPLQPYTCFPSSWPGRDTANTTVGQDWLVCSLKGEAAASPLPRQRLSMGSSPSRGGWG